MKARVAMVLGSMGLGCGAPPVATFDVECADQDCTSALFTADDMGNTTVFAWSIDGAVAGSGQTWEQPGDLTAAVRVRLDATSPGGTASSELWVVSNQAVTSTAEGTFEPVARGFDIVAGGDRTVDVECGLNNVITSIGGCFTGATPYALHLSMPITAFGGPPSPLGGPAYVAPATFLPDGPPVVSRGDWDGSRAWSGSGSVDDAWDTAVASASGMVPRFEAAFMPASPADSHWAVVMLPGPQKAIHERAVLLDCSGAALSVGSVAIDDRTLDDWAAQPR